MQYLKQLSPLQFQIVKDILTHTVGFEKFDFDKYNYNWDTLDKKHLFFRELLSIVIQKPEYNNCDYKTIYDVIKDTLNFEKLMIDYNLAYRRIPDVVYKTTSFINHKVGNELVKIPIDEQTMLMNKRITPIDLFHKCFVCEDRQWFRLLTRESLLPKSAGVYLVQQINDTDITPSWARASKGNTLTEAIINHFIK